MIQDVGERFEGSAATEGIRARLGAILDAVADGITVQDPTGRIVYANKMAVRLVGFASPAELMAASPTEILSRFELFDESRQPLSLAALPGRRALEGYTDPEATVGFRVLATGEEHWAQVRAQPLLDEYGAVAFAINTFHDISDRVEVEAQLRESEGRYRQLVEAMPQIAWTTDPAGSIELVNDRWIEYTGMTPELGAAIDADGTVHPDDREALGRSWAASLGAGDPLEIQSRIRRADGAYRWHLLRAVPLREDDGRIRAWIGTSTDVDGAKRAEDGLRVLADAAVRLDQTLDLDDTLEAAASVGVPILADWCLIDLVRPDGSMERVAVVTAEPDRDAVVAALRDYPARPAGKGPGRTSDARRATRRRRGRRRRSDRPNGGRPGARGGDSRAGCRSASWPFRSSPAAGRSGP